MFKPNPCNTRRGNARQNSPRVSHLSDGQGGTVTAYASRDGYVLGEDGYKPLPKRDKAKTRAQKKARKVNRKK